MSASTNAVHSQVDSNAESVAQCNYPIEYYPFEQYDFEEALYLQQLAFLHHNHCYLYDKGLVWTMNFLPDTVDDV